MVAWLEVSMLEVELFWILKITHRPLLDAPVVRQSSPRALHLEVGVNTNTDNGMDVGNQHT